MVNFTQLFTQAWTIAYGARFSYNARISGFNLVIAILMVVLPVCSEVVSGKATLWVIIGLLVILGVSIGVMQLSVFELGGMLPPKYIGAVLLGNGYSALFISFIRAVCIIAIPSDQLFL